MLFSDGESINSISSTSDDTLTVKQIYSTSCFTFDLNLKLTKKGFRTLGYASFEEELLTENQVQEVYISILLLLNKQKKNNGIHFISDSGFI